MIAVLIPRYMIFRRILLLMLSHSLIWLPALTRRALDVGLRPSSLHVASWSETSANMARSAAAPPPSKKPPNDAPPPPPLKLFRRPGTPPPPTTPPEKSLPMVAKAVPSTPPRSMMGVGTGGTDVGDVGVDEAATVVALLAAESPRAVAITSSGNDGGE